MHTLAGFRWADVSPSCFDPRRLTRPSLRGHSRTLAQTSERACVFWTPVVWSAHGSGSHRHRRAPSARPTRLSAVRLAYLARERGDATRRLFGSTAREARLVRESSYAPPGVKRPSRTLAQAGVTPLR